MRSSVTIGKPALREIDSRDAIFKLNSLSQKPEYYPNNIGQFAARSAGNYGYLLSGTHEKAPLQTVQNVLLKNHAKITSWTGYVDEKSNEFTFSFCCDLREAKLGPEDLLMELEQLKFVHQVNMVSMKDQIFDGLLFPLTLMDSIRIVGISSRFTHQIEACLETDTARKRMFDLGRNHTLEIIREIKQRLGERSSDATLYDNARGYLRSSGWGTFIYEPNTNHNFQHVLIKDPPTSENGEGTGNSFLKGMVAGIIEGVQMRRTNIVQESYDRTARLLSLTMGNEIVMKARAPDTRKQKTQADIKAKKLVAVEQVIRSVESEKHDDYIELMTVLGETMN